MGSYPKSHLQPSPQQQQNKTAPSHFFTDNFQLMTSTASASEIQLGSSPDPALTPDLDFWAGGGGMGKKIRNFPWAQTPLGDAAHWPQSLKTIVNFMLKTRHPVMVWWGPTLVQIYNDGFELLIGPDRLNTALGQTCCECWAEAWPIIGPQINQVIHGGASIWQENALIPIMRNGQLQDCYWTYSYSAIAELKAPGGIGGVMTVGSETTETVRAQKILERDSVWRNSPDLFVTLNHQGVFQAVNPAWEKLLGYRQDEVLGQRMEKFVWPEDLETSQAALIEALKQGNLADFRNRLRHKDGSVRWISWYTAKEGLLLFGYGRDVTREQQQAQALLDAELQLRQAQKMEAVGQLTGGIAHDFNNLLAGMMGSLALLERHLAEGQQTTNKKDDWRRYLSNAQTASRRATALTQRLLAFSRLQTLAPATVDVPTLVCEMLELLGSTVGPEIVLNFAAPLDAGLMVQADKNQLENALLNLCINARDAMPDGGTLTLEIGMVSLDASAIAALLMVEMQPGAFVQLKVSDTGCGMDAAVMNRAFDPFFTTKPQGQGTGLGLSMIYGFARQSGGFAQLESTPGKGTQVSIYLPRLPAAGAGGAPTSMASTAQKLLPLNDGTTPFIAQVAQVAQVAQRTILVVDDEAIVREFVVEVLAEEGFRVLQAGTAMQGLQVLRNALLIDSVDLLITDVGLPGGMNGRQFAEAAQQLQPGLLVLFITGFAESSVWRGGQLPTGMQVLGKPFEIDSLVTRVAHMLQTAHSLS